MATAKKKNPVLITTAHRGVFFGYLEDRHEDTSGLTVVLSGARCAIYWATKTGFLELAEKGPNERSTIGARAPEIELRNVTSMTKCSPQATEAWEAAK
jgi:hypothetical protein